MSTSDEERRLKALAQDHFRNSERLAKRCAQHEDCIERLEAINAELLEAAKTVLSGLNARIDAASSVPGGAVPVFAGIAMLHDAIGHAEREGGSDADA